jgi:acyl-CoA synthetase (AMP-forming)/AMP-acid ligase II/aryl carrier-like protein
MLEARTAVDLLHTNAQRDRAITYLEGENDARALRIADLTQRALSILHELQSKGATRGDKLIIFVASNEQFIQGFWGGVLGAIIPVPVAIGISDEHRHKLLRIARKLGRPFLYTDGKTLERLRAFAAEAGEQELFAQLESRTLLADRTRDAADVGRSEAAHPEDPLFIQFSSGSTSEPKGVVLTHANVLANARGASAAAGFAEGDIGLSWMPLTHDMGLVGMHLFMLANLITQYFMPTDLFIRRPLLWMEFASRYRASVTTSPNFGYRHFLKVLGERPVDHWNLSNLRVVFNGAEPVSRELADEFMTRMAPAQLRRTAMFPVYGLAEASLAVSFPKLGSAYHSLTFDRHHLNVDEEAVAAKHGERSAVELVSVGNAIPECEVRLCDDNDAVVRDGRVGHLHIRGANVTRGYYDDPEVNARSFAAGGWLRTGDLGLFKNGELYITGRAKDIIFINGQNYYPHDLEAIAQTAPGLELNKVVVAGVRTDKSATDELTAFVLHRGSMHEFQPTAAAVSRLINEHAGLEVDHVVPVKRIPKTTSGKLQRHLLVQSFLDGEFENELRELHELRQPKEPSIQVAGDSIASRLQSICDVALPDRNIGIDDNLFDVGVSSLKLVEIHERLDREFPGQLELTDVFEHPTIAELAKLLEEKLRGAR